MVVCTWGSNGTLGPATNCTQVAELTRIIEEDPLFKYPEKDDLIDSVRSMI